MHHIGGAELGLPDKKTAKNRTLSCMCPLIQFSLSPWMLPGIPLPPSGWPGPIILPFTHVLLSWKSPFYPSTFDVMISYHSFLFPSKQGARWLSSSEYSWIFLPWFPFDVHSCKRGKGRLVYLSSAAWDSWSVLAEYTKDVYWLSSVQFVQW